MFVRVVIVLVAAVLLWAVLARDTGASGAARSYRVRPGDTLWSISAREDPGDPRAGVWRIQQHNHLSGTTIVPGQRLSLP